MEKYKIKRVKDGSFKGEDGDTIKGFWVKALRISDGVTLEFWDTESHKEGEEKDFEVEKLEKSNGKFSYRLVK